MLSSFVKVNRILTKLFARLDGRAQLASTGTEEIAMLPQAASSSVQRDAAADRRDGRAARRERGPLALGRRRSTIGDESRVTEAIVETEFCHRFAPSLFAKAW